MTHRVSLKMHNNVESKVKGKSAYGIDFCTIANDERVNW